MTGIPETRSLKKWGVSNRSVVSSESNLLAPIDIRAPIPFQLELQQLYEHIGIFHVSGYLCLNLLSMYTVYPASPRTTGVLPCLTSKPAAAGIPEFACGGCAAMTFRGA